MSDGSYESQASLVLGTAGHIDHGKSALVLALTGTDPDRLPEEKARGVTIELGFARLELPSGRAMGVVDVPGHERFVRHMVAGATGIDVVLLVVAADDGVMPQTREHLAIIDLLGIDRGVVALTKSDLVDAEWISLVSDDVEGLLHGTSLEGAPIVAVSAKTGTGLEELVRLLDEVAGASAPRQASLPMRLPVDRVFTISGAGTVVTGTLWSGTVAKDDQVELLPSRKRARVRSVQVHSKSVSVATAGQRVALNLSGVDRDEIDRGDVAAAPGTLSVTDRFDARFTYLGWEGRPFESGTRVHIHHGTREVLGRVLLMDGEGDAGPAPLREGDSVLVQVRLEEPLAPRYQDRFIVRSYSPMYTIGGGVVLDAMPPRRTRLRSHERELLEALLAGDLVAAAVGLVESRGLPMSAEEVAAALGVPVSEVSVELERSSLGRLEAGGATLYVGMDALEALLAEVDRSLRSYHDTHPSATGVAVPTLRDMVDARLSNRAFDALAGLAVERGAAVVEAGSVRHPEAAGAAVAEQARAAEALSAILAEQGLSPASLTELANTAGVEAGVARKALSALVAEGRVVRLSGDLHFSAEAVEQARRQIVAYLQEHGTMLAKDARDVTGTSRKYVVPLLEYFDAQGVTKRDGDVRTLRSG